MREDVIVVGEGALGLATAEALASAGLKVTVIHDGATPAASVVAAGMLAPAFESALDPLMTAHAGLLRRARDLWEPVGERTGVKVFREGAAWRGPEAPHLASRLADMGFDVADATQTGLFTRDDWRLDPSQAGLALKAVRGVAFRAGHVRAVDAGRVILDGGEVVQASWVVVANGALAQALVALPISPVRGQIARLTGVGLSHGIRTPAGYAVPAADGGVLVGATMQPGQRSTVPDITEMTGFIGAVRTWIPELASGRIDEVRVGIRGATPDGLPLAGMIRPGLAVALAPRRNGWLLAPMVGMAVADAVIGQASTPDAAAFAPLRLAGDTPA